MTRIKWIGAPLFGASNVVNWFCLSFLILFLLALYRPATAEFTGPGPIFDYPQNGQSLDYEGAYLFRVFPLQGATGYLWGFFQNGIMIWENLRDEGHLSGNEYGIFPCSEAHNRFEPGPVDVWVRASFDGEWTEATIITIYLNPTSTPVNCDDTPAVVQVPVLQLNYFPPDPTNPEYLDPVETGWDNQTIAAMEQATQAMVMAGIEVISEATRYHGYSHPEAARYLDFTIFDKMDYYEPMPRGYPLSGTKYRPYYAQILANLDICSYVDLHGVKEVWIYGYHSDVIEPDESKMSSAYGDISNAEPKDEELPLQYRLPACNNAYVLYNFTYQPGGAGAIGNTIHNRMHQIENVIFFAENQGYPPDNNSVAGSTFWDDFSVYGDRHTLPGYRPSCGNTHSPPNAPGMGYVYDVLDYAESNCQTWHPDDDLTYYDNINCETWSCTDVGFYQWFMQNVPGYQNNIIFGGCQMRNWWEAMVDFNGFIDAGRTLYTCNQTTQQPLLMINFANGQPGSFFTVIGSNFPPGGQAIININGHPLGTPVTVNGLGNFKIIIETAEASPGYYIITAVVNPQASVLLHLHPDEPLRPQDNEGSVIQLPPGIAWADALYLPLIVR